MGFEAPRTILKLDFADTDLAGLEIRMRSQSVQEFSDHTRRAASMAAAASTEII